jgi:hypothetical protein
MNLKLHLLLIPACVLVALPLTAQQQPGSVDATIRRKPLDWNDPKWWDLMEPKAPGIKLGKNDFVIDGLAVESFRRSPAARKRTLREKFLGLPFVNPFSPKTQAASIHRENYFAWGQRDSPWTALADRPIPGPQSVLVSVHR